jgi:hypothetical protein
VKATPRALWGGLAVVLALALAARLLLLASGAVSFHSDEAVVGLMARGILQGERPTFFYGQAYMGSLDAWIVALGFAALGESVRTIHLVQLALFMGVVAATYGAAWALSGRVIVAVVAGLTLAVPSVLVALYSTATLGGYNETLLFGALIVLFGFPLLSGATGGWRWALIGVLAGLGWWTNALIAVYLLPVGVLLLARLWRERKGGARILIGPVLAAAGFALGSAPWWVFALEYDLAPLRFLFGSSGGGFASAETSQPLGVRLIGVAAFGLPAALGLRAPWSPAWFAPVAGVFVALMYAAGVVVLIRRRGMLKPGGRALVLGMIALLCAAFVLTRFSNDPTGRYFLPLTLPLGVVLGVLVTAISGPYPLAVSPSTREGVRQAAALGLVALVLIYHGAGQISAARGKVGLTTQFNVAEHIPANHDEDLIAFLREAGIASGYASYWSAFRLAFLSGGEITFSAALPPRDDLAWTPYYERIPQFRTAADAASPVFLTAGTPVVDAELERIFSEAGVTYSVEAIGVYRVYFGFAPVDAVPRPPLAFNAISGE